MVLQMVVLSRIQNSYQESSRIQESYQEIQEFPGFLAGNSRVSRKSNAGKTIIYNKYGEGSRVLSFVELVKYVVNQKTLLNLWWLFDQESSRLP